MSHQSYSEALKIYKSTLKSLLENNPPHCIELQRLVHSWIDQLTQIESELNEN